MIEVLKSADLDWPLSYSALFAPSRSSAVQFFKSHKEAIAQQVVALKQDFKIYYDTSCKQCLTISPRLAADILGQRFSTPDLPGKKEVSILSDPQLTLLIEETPHSGAIVRNHGNKILAASTAIAPNAGMPAHEAIGEKITVLWHPDELERLVTFLERDRHLQNYEYWTWRWQGENRVKQQLSSNFWSCTYKEVPCRLSLGTQIL